MLLRATRRKESRRPRHLPSRTLSTVAASASGGRTSPSSRPRPKAGVQAPLLRWGRSSSEGIAVQFPPGARIRAIGRVRFVGSALSPCACAPIQIRLANRMALLRVVVAVGRPVQMLVRQLVAGICRCIAMRRDGISPKSAKSDPSRAPRPTLPGTVTTRFVCPTATVQSSSETSVVLRSRDASLICVRALSGLVVI